MPLHLNTAGLAPVADRLAADLAALSEYADPDAPGWSREVFSEPYRAERVWIRDRMRDAGLETTTDAAGNVVGRLPGTHGGPPLVTGSHTDTVHGGGRFDGIVGVLGGIEAARRIRETGTHLAHDLLVVDFLGEEANRFGISCMGSRSLAGILTPGHLARTDSTGLRLGEAMQNFGADPDRALGLGWGANTMHAYVELHVEQGPLLEQHGIPIGVVTAIAGIERLLATFRGRADHAGTMPMGQRHDALIAAAEAVLTIERVGCGAPVHGVTTTGRIESSPGVYNIVPDEAKIWAETRSVDHTWLSGVRHTLAGQIAGEAAQRGVEVDVEWLNDQDPVLASRSVQDVIAQAADTLGIPWMPVPSGAGHDAAHMAHLGPMGMIFIPSRGGRSHCPEEWTDLSQLVTGTHVLATTLAQLDGSVLSP
ncbi:M20 family metallo-hydrolase [Streptomyces sp. SID10853]|uniref:M20 family metallo-hydrolase n=1 Tax=Streptomyces sp. SID10853 TaxID=2706028 RepID=UPI0013BF3D33|nr:M20 family metallo-hydrolase [Streptomyces sp. SID10853]NDZ78682.1 M20 family metallo-hydrolase [Streptomyces sp. SID10853]